MASVYKLKNKSRYWNAKFRMPDGKWVVRTTKQTDRGAAMRLAFAWEGLAGSPGELSATGAAVARVTREIFEQATRTKIKVVAIGEFFHGWLSRVNSTRAKGTAGRYRQVIEGFLAHLGPNAERQSIATLTPSVLQGFIDAESAKGKGAHTVTLAGKTLHIAVKSAFRAGLIETNPAASIELPDFKMQDREEFTAGDVEMLLREACGTEWEIAIMFAAYCGCRLGDAVSMKWSNVDLAGSLLEFVPQKSAHGKSRKTLTNPMPPRLLARLNTLAGGDSAQSSEHITSGLAERRVGGRSGLSMAFNALMRRAGLEIEIVAPEEGKGSRSFRKKSFHSLRHFYISQLRRSGADRESAQAAAGHSDEATHSRYDHDKRDRVRRQLTAAVANFPGANSD